MLLYFAQLRLFFGDPDTLIDDGDNGVKYETDRREVKSDIAQLALLFGLLKLLGTIRLGRRGLAVIPLCFWLS